MAGQSGLVESWFGSEFADLHPLLQKLHRQGGRLSGDVDVSYGSGLARVVGVRLAAKMKLPVAGKHHLLVDISHADNALVWARSFDGATPVISYFYPVGRKSDGYWEEKSGALKLQLTVEIQNGGWYWCCQKMQVAGLSLPLWLLPKSTAYKVIEDGRYKFAVRFSLPLLGTLVSYQGLLDAEPA